LDHDLSRAELRTVLWRRTRPDVGRGRISFTKGVWHRGCLPPVQVREGPPWITI
jgi:hypothetical protein